jgi:hypothetical protein
MKNVFHLMSCSLGGEMIDLFQKMDWKNAKISAVLLPPYGIPLSDFCLRGSGGCPPGTQIPNSNQIQIGPPTTHGSRITTYQLTTYHVLLIGCASVLKIVHLKSNVSGGAKRR